MRTLVLARYLDWKPMRAPLATRPAFTLVELLVVMAIIAIIATLGASRLNKFTSSSRVKQTAELVITTLFKARAEALRHRQPVGVFFGDDPARYKAIWNSPLKDVLPKKGTIEIW
ncbi:MAG TPA: prepilin-type N-terminal cleavage/methylation domain-containing protein, partial [Planctomycetota bacterium]|nr:prepilin-type N-terminal cleavage/methylation domain-containing protein [Planctomycetota bacterium]